MAPAERITQIRQEIEHHNRLYYQEAQPEISDQQFDALLRELIDLEAAHPDLITPDSPTQRVGGEPIEGFTQIQHTVPMMSLDNTYSEAELRDFFVRLQKALGRERIACVIEPKVDGVAITIRYQDGVLKHGATRGDGRTGDDVTANLKTIRTLPISLPKGLPQTFEVRGEVFMTKAGFARLNKEREEAGEPLYANPRNTTAGTLKQLDPRITAKRPLDIVCYGLADPSEAQIAKQSEVYDLLKRAKMRVADFLWHVETADEAVNAIRELDLKRHDLPYETDGAVIKVDAFVDQRELGATSKAPRWAIAYKYAPEQAETKVLAVDIQVGRTGALTPVARLVPVFLSGSTVSNATLHNFDEIQRKDIRIGDVVIIEKAGEIIPAVVQVLAAKRTGDEMPIPVPSQCPVCGSGVMKDPEQVVLRCGNPDCPEQVKRRLEHFVHRGAMDIAGLGSEKVGQFVDAGLIAGPADIYHLDADKLKNVERLGAKSIDNLLKGIEASKQQPPWRLLFGLGIRHVGAASARSLLEHFSNVEAIAQASIDELTQVPDVGAEVAPVIHAWFRDEKNQNLLQQLKQAGLTWSQREIAAASDRLAGTTWVITGTLSQGRDEIADIIRSHGGKVSGSVSSKTTYLLAGEEAGSKMDKAAKLGVRIVDEAKFREMVS